MYPGAREQIGASHGNGHFSLQNRWSDLGEGHDHACPLSRTIVVFRPARFIHLASAKEDSRKVVHATGHAQVYHVLRYRMSRPGLLSVFPIPPPLPPPVELQPVTYTIVTLTSLPTIATGTTSTTCTHALGIQVAALTRVRVGEWRGRAVEGFLALRSTPAPSTFTGEPFYPRPFTYLIKPDRLCVYPS